MIQSQKHKSKASGDRRREETEMKENNVELYRTIYLNSQGMKLNGCKDINNFVEQ